MQSGSASAGPVDRKAGMQRPTREDDSRARDRNHLHPLRAANAVRQRRAPVHGSGLDRPEQRTGLHQEVRLHPGITTRRDRNRRRVMSTPPSEPSDGEIPIGTRWRKAYLHCNPLDHASERIGPDAAEQRDRPLGAVVDGNQHGKATTRDAPHVGSTRPNGAIAPGAASRPALDTTKRDERTLDRPITGIASAGDNDRGDHQERDSDIAHPAVGRGTKSPHRVRRSWRATRWPCRLSPTIATTRCPSRVCAAGIAYRR